LTGSRSSRWPASSSFSDSDFAADRLSRRSRSTSRHHPSSSTSGQGARVGKLRIAISSARTVDSGNGPLRSRLRQRTGRVRAAGGPLSRATSHRLLPSFAIRDIGRRPAAPSPAARNGGDSEYAYKRPIWMRCRVLLAKTWDGCARTTMIVHARARRCGGAGMPCLVCNQPKDGERPRLPPDFVPQSDRDRGPIN
jgi:hypothetical protein